MLKRIALLLTGLAQPLSGALAPVLNIGTPIGTATRGIGAPEQPLSVFFSIWGVIFALYILFAILTLVRHETWMDRVIGPLLVAGLLNVVWMVSAQLIASQPVDFLLLFPILGTAWTACYRFDRVRGMGGSIAKLAADAATGMLAGWLTVAVAISIPLTVRSFTSLGATDAVWLMLYATLGTGAIGAALFADRMSRSLWFFVSLAWGLTGIALANWTANGLHWLAILTAICGALIIFTRLTQGASGSRAKA